MPLQLLKYLYFIPDIVLFCVFFLFAFTSVIIVYAFQELSLDIIILLCIDAIFCSINYCSVFNTLVFFGLFFPKLNAYGVSFSHCVSD